MTSYSRLPDPHLPSHPPSYDEQAEASASGQDGAGLGGSSHFEQFEIDEDEVYEPAKRGSLLQRLRFRSSQIVCTFKDQVVAPAVHLSQPVRDIYAFVATRYDQSITKLGNPLVIKRLLYVFAVVAVTFAIPLNGNSEAVNGASGGAFSNGKFYDIEKLGATIKQFVDVKTLKENTEYFSSMPHFAGTTGDLAIARYIEDFYKANGIDSSNLHELDSFLNFPKRDGTYVQLADGSFEATLHEDGGDRMQNLAFNPNSPSSDGEISASYVYAGHGTPADLERLHQNGVDVKDAILLIKYGGDIPEANKVALAHQNGAKAIVFISSSMQWAGTVHEDYIQKTNVGLTRYSPGDVLTPGWSSHDSHSARLDWHKSVVTAKIPCIPVSYKDGQHLLERLGSAGVQFDDNFWSGAKAESDQIKLRVSHEERSTHSIWNVVGSILGREQSEKGVIFGAPRDSVGYGAATSASSTAVLLELVKALTSLQRRYDWTPARSIYFVSFDASEYNLAGSTEWAESKRKELEHAGFAYIEVSDIQVGDILSVTANPLLQDLVKDEMKKVELSKGSSGDAKISLYDLFKEQHDGKDHISNNFLQAKDYIPFINSLNIPSIDIGFRSKSGNTPKQSCLDSFSNFEKDTDPQMRHHVAIAELLARIGFRLAEEPFIPYNFNVFIDELSKYKTDLEKFVADEIKKVNSDVTPQMHFGALRSGIDRLADGTRMLEGFRKDWNAFVKESSSVEPVMLAAERRSTNNNMLAFNNVFLAQGGVPDRAGYVNFLFGLPFDAPDHQDETYEWNTFPMVRDFVMKGEYGKAQFEVTRISELLEAASHVITI